MISYVTGTLGAGKTIYSVRKASRALLEGKVVVSNVRFVDGWESVLLGHHYAYRFASRGTRAKMRREVSERFAYVPEVDRLLSARVHGRGERRGVMVFDEAHNQVNNRDWDKDGQKEALTNLTLARKRGWQVYVVSQHKDNTDAMVRRIATMEIRLVNWQQLTRVPILGTNLLPFPVFLANAYILNVGSNIRSATKPLFRELYGVSWYGRMYDTFQDYGEDLSTASDALWLPVRSSGGAPGAALGTSAVPAPTTALSSALVPGGEPTLRPVPPDAL